MNKGTKCKICHKREAKSETRSRKVRANVKISVDFGQVGIKLHDVQEKDIR